MGLTTVRHFRDKLAMRGRAKEEGINVPEFIHVLNHASLQDFMSRVKPPWLLKPRSQASGIGMKKINAAADLWPLLEQLGDAQSHYLLEQFVPGDVFHVDSIVSESKVRVRRSTRLRFAAARYFSRRRRIHHEHAFADRA